MATELAAILHRLDLLEREVARLGDENTVLKRCLAKTGALRPDAEAAQSHRLKFERVCKQNPVESAAGLEEVAQPAVFNLIKKFGGAGEQAALARTSSVSVSVMRKVCSPLKGVVYAIGGFDGRVLSAVQWCDPERNLWGAAAPMPTARFNLAVASSGRRLYAMGGGDGVATFFHTLERFDSQAWEEVAPMPTARWGHAAVALGGRVYAVGGMRSNDGVHEMTGACEVYDPEQDAWQVLAPMPTGRCWLGAASLGGRIYAVGGTTRAGAVDAECQWLDPERGSWQPLAPMPTARSGLARSHFVASVYETWSQKKTVERQRKGKEESRPRPRWAAGSTRSAGGTASRRLVVGLLAGAAEWRNTEKRK